MLRVCQSHQSITNQAHLIPLTCPIQLSPRFNNIHLGFFYLPVLRFYSNRPTRSSPLTTTAVPYLLTTRSRLYRSSISHLVQLFLLDLICAFYRSDLLFILSESPSPEQQRLHDNSSLILSAAICSFR